VELLSARFVSTARSSIEGELFELKTATLRIARPHGSRTLLVASIGIRDNANRCVSYVIAGLRLASASFNHSSLDNGCVPTTM
jgi:hypothetical protein